MLTFASTSVINLHKLGLLKNYSPLRYPGGKACLTNFLSEHASINDGLGGTYVELYAGGAGAALNLLFNNVFEKIHINDYDFSIYAFWYAVLNFPEQLIRKIEETDASIEEWKRQQQIYSLGKSADLVDLGFATFFLNRTNRSGIIFKAGPIGGLEQTGNYKINVRFNKAELIGRIAKINSLKDRILLTNLDAVDILDNLSCHHQHLSEIFLYLDPPYYNKGKYLYLNNYSHLDHLRLSKSILQLNDLKWIISYDNIDQIKQLYESNRMAAFDLNYSLQTKKNGSELLIFSDSLKVSKYIRVNSKKEELILI